ncbi:MAG: hypothetical protein LBC20_02760 [Planctomycetaceae bacterium]|nr:hypothetical protein [Planctomycetaceae bacterium]
MKNRLQQFVQNKIFRWLLSTVILCYALVPKIGVCHCLDCRCNKDYNLHQITVTAEESTDSACCCGSQESDISTGSDVSTVTQSCCSRMLTKTVLSDVQQESPVCPCSLKSVPKQSTFISSSSISFRQNSDELLIDGYSPYSFSVMSIPVIKIVTFYRVYESLVSLLPVRLHLLLLVLLN